jgi:hypothetical protein
VHRALAPLLRIRLEVREAEKAVQCAVPSCENWALNHTLDQSQALSSSKRKTEGEAAAGETEGEAIEPKRKRRKIVPTLLDILGAQVGAPEAMGFNRITRGFCRHEVQRGVPVDGTPVFCLDTVDWPEAAKQDPTRFSAK